MVEAQLLPGLASLANSCRTWKGFLRRRERLTAPGDAPSTCEKLDLQSSAC